jgi:hypothetical protein
LPLPLTVALPTVVPPAVQAVGAAACGPNTLKVTLPLASLVAPESAELIALAAIAVPVASLAGAATVVVVAFPTTNVNDA